jgi:hypothetical protein
VLGDEKDKRAYVYRSEPM